MGRPRHLTHYPTVKRCPVCGGSLSGCKRLGHIPPELRQPLKTESKEKKK